MDYLLTYEDGSSAYLAHHGTKGMKWGVWNAETAARYGGESGAKRFNKDMSNLAKQDRRISKYGSKRDAIQRQVEASAKSAKNQQKLAKYKRKAAVNSLRANRPYFTDFGASRRRKQQKKALKYSAKAQKIESGNIKQQSKMIKYNAKVLKASNKATKISNKMIKNAASIQMSNVTAEQRELGRKYVSSVFK